MTNPDNTQTKLPSAFTSRRHFIQTGAALLGAAWLGTLVQSKLFPQASTAEAKPITLALADLPVGSAREITYAGAPAIVLRTAESIKAFSLVCTHLGCTVQWQANKKEFYCPCHDGRFDQFGEVLAGPPPLPLEEYPVTVDGDCVIVGELA